MKQRGCGDMNYVDTFITVAPDCPATRGTAPPLGSRRSVGRIEYELLTERPSFYTQEELLFQVHLASKEIPAPVDEAQRKELWRTYWSKPHACSRASTLAKRYGWGFHFDNDGKTKLVAVESPEYQRLLDPASGCTIIPALRNQRVSSR